MGVCQSGFNEVNADNYSCNIMIIVIISDADDGNNYANDSYTGNSNDYK